MYILDEMRSGCNIFMCSKGDWNYC